MLEIIGFILAVLDYTGLSKYLERALDKFRKLIKKWVKSSGGAIDKNLDGMISHHEAANLFDDSMHPKDQLRKKLSPEELAKAKDISNGVALWQWVFGLPMFFIIVGTVLEPNMSFWGDLFDSGSEAISSHLRLWELPEWVISFVAVIWLVISIPLLLFFAGFPLILLAFLIISPHSIIILILLLLYFIVTLFYRILWLIDKPRSGTVGSIGIMLATYGILDKYGILEKYSFLVGV